MGKTNTKLKFLLISTKWLINIKVRKGPILALKCTFLGQTKLNMFNQLKMKKNDVIVFYTWYKPLMVSLMKILAKNTVNIGEDAEIITVSANGKCCK